MPIAGVILEVDCTPKVSMAVTSVDWLPLADMVVPRSKT